MANNNENKILNVPNLRFPEFQGEWEEHLLGNISDVTKLAGFEFTKYVTYEDNGNIIAIRGLNCKNGSLDLRDVKYIDNSDFSKLSRSKLYTGDILYTYVGTVGEVAVVDKNDKYYLAPNVSRIRLSKDYNSDFIKQMLGSKKFYNQIVFPLIATSSQPALSMENLRKFKLKVPSIREQTKIASLLNAIDERIATQNKIIEDLKKLKSAIYQNLFFHLQGDKVPLSELAEIIKGQQINGSELSENGKYYVMNGGITPSGYYDNYNTEADTISISEGGNSCGYVQYNSSDFWSGGHCYTLRIKPTALISTPFLFHFLKWKEPDIMALRSGSGLPNIQKKDLSKVCIIVPTLDEQQQLIALLSTFQMKIENEEIFTSNLNKQKQHLLSQMFI